MARGGIGTSGLLSWDPWELQRATGGYPIWAPRPHDTVCASGARNTTPRVWRTPASRRRDYTDPSDLRVILITTDMALIRGIPRPWIPG